MNIYKILCLLWIVLKLRESVAKHTRGWDFCSIPKTPPIDLNVAAWRDKLIKMENSKNFISSSSSEKRNILFIKLLNFSDCTQPNTLILIIVAHTQ